MKKIIKLKNLGSLRVELCKPSFEEEEEGMREIRGDLVELEV